jgi:hypothetical protein
MSQDNLVEMYLNNVWRANLSITGSEGLPPISMAGNVLRPTTSVRCSLRLPPTYDAKKGNQLLEELLTKDPPHNAKITLHGGHCGSGWCQKVLV